jgi:hypothetical protein
MTLEEIAFVALNREQCEMRTFHIFHRKNIQAQKLYDFSISKHLYISKKHNTSFYSNFKKRLKIGDNP